MISNFDVSQPPSFPRSQCSVWGRSLSAWVTTLASLAGATLTLAVATPAQALQVTVTPSKPQLGDTLTVVASYDNLAISATPTVTLGQQTHPTFLVGANRFRALLPTTPLDRPGKLQIQVSGEGETKTVTVDLKKRSFPTQSIWLPPGKDDDISDYEFNLVDAFKKLVTPQKFWNGAFLRPNQGEITTIYGVQRYYNGKFAQDYYHRGVDYAGGYGSPVIAPAAGRIALVGRESQGFKINGNVVGIDHGQGVVSIMLHLSRINVKEGDMVKAGQVVGTVGATGAAAGPHLHWGLYVQGQSVDPVPWRTKSFE